MEKKGQDRHGFKAYNPGLVCRGYQYAENEIFKKNGHGICVPGVTHYCVNPFDVLDYYPLVRDDGKFSDFTTVEAIDEPVTDDGKKFATSTIKIGAKLGLDGFIKACVDFLYEKTIKEMPKSKVETGDSAQIGSSGYCAKIGSSGYCAKIDITGSDSVGAAVGFDSRIKAALGNWITLAEWAYSEEKERYVPLCVKSAQIDGEALKPDVWYMLKNGEFVEADGQGGD